MSYGPFAFLDQKGQPLDPRIAHAVQRFVPRLKRTFPGMGDDVNLAEIVEEAARRVSARHARREIRHLDGYAWATLRTVAISRLRTTEVRARLRETSISDQIPPPLAATPGDAPDRAILLHELLEFLHGEDRMVSALKLAGLSSGEIGRCVGLSAVAVDTIYCRAKEKLRRRCAPASLSPGTD